MQADLEAEAAPLNLWRWAGAGFCYFFSSYLRPFLLGYKPISCRYEAQAVQMTSPLHAVASTTTPNAMRYQAKGTKLWLAM